MGRGMRENYPARPLWNSEIEPVFPEDGFSEAPQRWEAFDGQPAGTEPLSNPGDPVHLLPPDLSVASGLNIRQKQVFILGGTLLAGLTLWLPGTVFMALTSLFLIFFAAVIGMRLVFMVLPVIQGKSLLISPDLEAVKNRTAWPRYSIFVALYRESEVLPILVNALENLDYPANRLDIKLICEAGDTETLSALEALKLTAPFDRIIVPDSAPKTKPKALNHALPLATGKYLVIYDAEDKPEPGQLKRAVLAFEGAPDDMACLQARLGYFNDRENWLTRMFTIEYAIWFELILPGLRALRLPIPLGGTSIHFRTNTLKRLGGWDAHNVTEDADLGMRLARWGYHCGVLDSTTFEEANCQLGNWIRQRSRWIKGYLQTWGVHMRNPAALWREIGPSGFWAMQLVLLGTVISAFTQPIFWGFLILWLGTGWAVQPLTIPAELAGLHSALLFFGVVVVVLSGVMAICRAGKPGLALWAPSLFLYWPLAAIAAYRAVWQLITRPFYWEKTRHGLSRQTAPEQIKALRERTFNRRTRGWDNWSG